MDRAVVVKSVDIAGVPFRIMRAPDPLTDERGRYWFSLAMAERVIWIDPALRGEEREEAISAGVSAAWARQTRVAVVA